MEQMDAALHLTLDRAEAAEAELARVQAKLDGLLEAFEKNGSLGILQVIAADKNLPPEIRVRAATAAVPYERGRPATVNVVGVVDFRERVRNARLRADAEMRAKWAAEDAARTIEHQPSVLASDHGGDPMGPEDPAA
jgi:hypothetical protein